MAITSTGGYIGNWYWANSGIHPDFPHWGEVRCLCRPVLTSDGWSAWAGNIWPIQQIINWRFHDDI